MTPADRLVETLLTENPALWYHRHHVGTENPHEEGYGEDDCDCDVYEFPSDDLQKKFLDEVGGKPHPLGGKRAIMTK